MCTYDYTPYTGCKDGQQHFYIQWVKCNKAVERNRYCSLDESTELEHLKKLSTNVISCPIHGAVAVQQHAFEFVYAQAAEEPATEDHHSEMTERSRARNTTRRDDTASRNRDLGLGQGIQQPVRKEVRKRRSARQVHPASSDTETERYSIVRPKTVEPVKRTEERGRPGKRASSLVREESHQLANPGDLDSLSTRSLSHHDHNGASSRLTAGRNQQTEEESTESATGNVQTRLKSSLTIPPCSVRIGLPSSPDILRRSSGVHKSKSEMQLQQGQESPSKPTAHTTSPRSADSSPDHNSELPFGNSTQHRGRRSGTRSTHNRSVDRSMKRIDEHAISRDDGTGERQDTRSSTTSQSTTISPVEPPQNTDAPSLPTSPKSLQFGGTSASPLSPTTSTTTHGARPNEDAASVRSGRSRRFFFLDHAAEGRGRAGAGAASPRSPTMSASMLAHLSESHLPWGSRSATGRESVDSGYRSLQGGSTSPGGVGLGLVGLGITAPPGELGGEGTGPSQKPLPRPGQGGLSRPVPAPLGLGNRGLPPCALPVELALLSPGHRYGQEIDGGKGGKVPLLQRMGLRRKLSGLWEWGGQRQTGLVEG
ncbi:hypothetical protein MFIFM68171_08104 [Madurella fahalii]|uniref:Uncharacterized protein n=1 Tax=Madurella fahalii TaxID=1157608 RepID=A0ABQ0GJM3_9PEZI